MSAPFVSSRVVHSLDGPEGVGDGTLMIAKLFRVVVAARAAAKFDSGDLEVGF